MPAPQPLSKADELHERVRAFIRKVSSVNVKETMEFRRLVREAQDLAKEDVVVANCLEGLLVGLAGDDQGAERLFDNAAANGGVAEAKTSRLSHYANRMYCRRAHEVGLELLDKRHGIPFRLIAHRVLMTGGFHAVAQAVERSQERSEVLQLTKDIEGARVAAEILDRLQIDDAYCVAVLDAFGEVIREHGLVWLDDFPALSGLMGVDDEYALMVNFSFAVSPAAAAEICWQFTDLLMQRNLDRPGFYVRAIGQGVDVPVAEPV